MRKFFTLFFVELKLQLGLQTLKEGFKSGPKGILKSLGYLLVAALLGLFIPVPFELGI